MTKYKLDKVNVSGIIIKCIYNTTKHPLTLYLRLFKHIQNGTILGIDHMQPSYFLVFQEDGTHSISWMKSLLPYIRYVWFYQKEILYILSSVTRRENVVSFLRHYTVFHLGLLLNIVYKHRLRQKHHKPIHLTNLVLVWLEQTCTWSCSVSAKLTVIVNSSMKT